MGRWEPNARGRLEEAAMQLYLERGFDETTVAEIAERAGLTERTFFRHFADKREVLFYGAEALRSVVVEAVAAAPVDAAPIDAVGAALEAAGRLIEQRRDGARHRQAVIDANSELRERELVKLASLGEAMADSLRRRGVGELPAELAAEAGIAALKVGFARWLRQPDRSRRDLAELVRQSLEDLGSVTTGAPLPTRGAARRTRTKPPHSPKAPPRAPTPAPRPARKAPAG